MKKSEIVVFCLFMFSLFSVVGDVGVEDVNNIMFLPGSDNLYEFENKNIQIVFLYSNETTLNFISLDYRGVNVTEVSVPSNPDFMNESLIVWNKDGQSIQLNVEGLEIDVDTGFNWVVTTNDTEGHIYTETLTLTIKNDSLAPRYTLNSPENYSFVKNGSILFNISINESESGLGDTNLEYEYVSMASPKTESTLSSALVCEGGICTTTISREGNYVGFYFNITDRAGNKDHTDWNDATWYYIYVDEEEPVVDLVSPASGAFIGSDNSNFTYNMSDNSFVTKGQGDFDPKVNCSLYFVNSTDTIYMNSRVDTDNVTDAVITANLNSIADDIYNWYIVCVDVAGWSKQSEVRNVTVDRLGPVIAMVSHNDDDIINNNTNLTFLVTDVPSGTDKVWWVSGGNNGEFEGTGDGSYILNSGELLSDLNNLEVYANDTVGNTANINFSIYVDDKGPNIILVFPDDGDVVNEEIFKFVPSDVYSSELDCRLSLNGNLEPEVTVQNSSQYNWSVDLDDGEYVWNVTCVDEVGNSNTSETRTVTIDVTAPAVSLDYPINVVGYNSDNINAETGFSDFNYSVVEVNLNICSLYINESIWGIGVNNFTINFAVGCEVCLDSQNNPYQWYVNCTDDTGNSNVSGVGYLYYDLEDPDINESLIRNGTPSSSSVTIYWEVINEVTNNTVYYGTNSSSLSSSERADTTSATPEITLSSLDSLTIYFYKVESCDQFGRCVNSTGSYNFTTSEQQQNNNGDSPGGGGGRRIIQETEEEEECSENWNCGSWSSCVEGIQTRACIDGNACGTEELRPDEMRECEEETGSSGSAGRSQELGEEDSTTQSMLGGQTSDEQSSSPGVGQAIGLFDRIKSNGKAIAAAVGILALLGLLGWKRKAIGGAIGSSVNRISDYKSNKAKKEEESIREKLKQEGIIK